MNKFKVIVVSSLVAASLIGLYATPVNSQASDSKIIKVVNEKAHAETENESVMAVLTPAPITPVPVKINKSDEIIFEKESEEISNDDNGFGEEYPGNGDDYSETGGVFEQSEISTNDVENDGGTDIGIDSENPNEFENQEGGIGNGEDCVGEMEEPEPEPEPEVEQESEPELEYLGDWTITAYCGCAECCGSWGNATASGRTPMSGHTIACNSLPFYTQVMIDGVVYTVEDTGWSPYGDAWIDIYFDSHEEALAYGLHTASVYIVR